MCMAQHAIMIVRDLAVLWTLRSHNITRHTETIFYCIFCFGYQSLD